MNDGDPLQKPADQRAALGALHRLATLAREEIAQEQSDRSWARRFGLVFACVAGVILLIALAGPDALRGMFRTITGVAR